MSATANADPPLTEVELVPEKETIEDVKEPAPAFPCQLADIELVYKIAQSFLPGLATACVDNTTGGIFRTPGSVAAELRTEMIDYLTQRSETFVAESVILSGDDPQTENTSDNPFDIVSDFVDDFASTKRNFFSRVSGWLLSEKREDKIDDFVQDMEVNGFWLVDKRSTVAEALLKNVDLKNRFHCDQKFNTEEELAGHVAVCGFRSSNCNNEGCDVTFSAKNLNDHDSICPFKIIPCEQSCSEHIMRRDMDRHCITVCKMKIVACPFYAVGCQANVPNSMMDQHRSEQVRSHVLSTLVSMHKEASVDDLQPRADQVLEMSSGLAEARDVRSLTRRIKNIEAKLGPLEIKPRKKDEDSPTKNAEKVPESENKAAEEKGTSVDKETTAESANKVSEVISRAVESVSNESNEPAANKVTQESTEAAKPVDKESNEQPESIKVSERSTEAAKPVDKESNEPDSNKVTEESTEAAKPVHKESHEQLDSNKVTEESSEAAKPVDKESNDQPDSYKVTEESTEAAKHVDKESNEPAANNVTEESEQATHNLDREVTEAELTVVEEPAKVSTDLGKESTESPDKLGEDTTKNLAAESAAEEINESTESANAVQNLDKELTESAETAIEEPAEEGTNNHPPDAANKPAAEERTKEPTSTTDDADKESSEAAKIKSEDPAPTS
ncbi:hypothetical protein LINPERHAP2_LOCUS14025 [Linum perenne]